MGAVYLGSDSVLDRRVALKVMLPQHAADSEGRERFLREARTAAMVRCDHVVTIFDVGEERDVPFIAMEYLLGRPLDQYLWANGEFASPQLLRVGRETAAGLAAAHARGLVHRDVKPGNIWLEAPHGRVKLLDFGLARATDDTHLTTSGLVVGTPAFMSPEQARGLAVDGRSDLFSLGVVLYRLATGRMPFRGTSTMAVLTALAVDTPVPVRELKPDLPEALEVVISRLLAKDPADRYQDAQDVIDALDAAEQLGTDPLPVVVPLLAQPTAAGAPTGSVWEGIESPDYSARSQGSALEVPVRIPGGHKKRLPMKLLLGAVAGTVVAALVAILIMSRGGPAHAPTVSEKEPERAVPTDQKPKRQVAPDMDHRGADFILSRGGEVRITVGGKASVIRPPAALPPERLTLTGFTLTGKQIGLEDTERLQDFKSLTHIALKDTSVDELGLSFLKGNDQLEHLILELSPITDVSLNHFSACKNLRVLSLRDTGITDYGTNFLADCKKLTHLILSGTNVTDKGLAALRGNNDLVVVALSRTGVSDNALAQFGGASALEELELARTSVTDSALVHVARWTRLKVLDLQGTGVTDAGLEHLKNTSLRSLNLSGTKITDEALAHLGQMTSLRVLDLAKTLVTPAGVKQLRSKLSRCDITFGNGG